jgi:hypothetical protein
MFAIATDITTSCTLHSQYQPVLSLSFSDDYGQTSQLTDKISDFIAPPMEHQQIIRTIFQTTENVFKFNFNLINKLIFIIASRLHF